VQETAQTKRLSQLVADRTQLGKVGPAQLILSLGTMHHWWLGRHSTQLIWLAIDRETILE